MKFAKIQVKYWTLMCTFFLLALSYNGVAQDGDDMTAPDTYETPPSEAPVVAPEEPSESPDSVVDSSDDGTSYNN